MKKLDKVKSELQAINTMIEPMKSIGGGAKLATKADLNMIDFLKQRVLDLTKTVEQIAKTHKIDISDIYHETN